MIAPERLTRTSHTGACACEIICLEKGWFYMRNSNLWMKKRFVSVQENVFADYMKMLHDERKNVEVEIQSSDHTVKLRVWILTLAPRSYYILMSAESTHIPPDNEIYCRLSFHIVLFCVNISVQHEEMHFFYGCIETPPQKRQNAD